MSEQPVLLGVFAHPDDESYGAGGTLARYAAAGVAVHIVVATDGAAGSARGQTTPDYGPHLAQVRAAELATAAAALGVAGFEQLPYRDSGMRGSPENNDPQALIQQPEQDVIVELIGIFRRLRPQVVITHDPFGGYGHPDHIRVSHAVTAAFHAAGDPTAMPPEDGRAPYRPHKLYYTAMDRRAIRIAVRIVSLLGQDPTRFGRNHDLNLLEMSQMDTPIHARIDTRAWVEERDAAIRAHASQYGNMPPLFRMLPAFLRRRLWGRETFSRAYPPPDGEIETDLFAGLTFSGR
jgi:mycothiol S-conjugate amidase